jgi:hypothetical protein
VTLAAPIASDIHAEAERLTGLIAAARRPIRLMGGLAVWLVAPSVRRPPYERPYADLDFAASGRDRSGTSAFFESAGYVPEKLFNALHGATRLNFRHPEGTWTVDVLFDELDMSHKIDLRRRLEGPGPTLDLADLLLTKLQVWEINRKDLGDIACLLADCGLSTNPVANPPAATAQTIDMERVIALTRVDWGLCHTVERNLRQVAELAAAEPPIGAGNDPVRAAQTILAAIAAAPKSTAWRLRARIGERLPWYQTPEEVRHEA